MAFSMKCIAGSLAAGALVAEAFGAPFIPEGLTVDRSAPRPNILVMLIDDMGYSDLAAFGSRNVSTPNIDALISSGTKMTQWISAAPICTPSRAALMTGRYPIRTGCMGNIERTRVIATPSNPGGLDPSQHLSLAAALKQAGYATGMSGKWHLGISGNTKLFSKQDFRYHPNAHGYDSYLGSPYTNAPTCAMDDEGLSNKYSQSPSFCFMMANTTVVQQPLRVQNFTRTITQHAVDFLGARAARNQAASEVGEEAQPWHFFMSWFHVHSPLFTNSTNRGRSKGGYFGDNVEELDDSVGDIMAALHRHGFSNNTLIFLTSDNGPYQEEGWENSGRTVVYDSATGEPVGRLKGGKGQLFEGGVRMPGAVVWPGVVAAGKTSDVMVSTMDIFPTALAAAGVSPGESYLVDGKSMLPALTVPHGQGESQHDVFLHYCGFNIYAARVLGRFKVFWATPKWYTHDPADPKVCMQCCNGVIRGSSTSGAPATHLCGCDAKDMDFHDPPLVFDMAEDMLELSPLSADNWPETSGISIADVLSKAAAEKASMEEEVHPKPEFGEAGHCTAGMPSSTRQPCCPGCRAQPGALFPSCKSGVLGDCKCDALGDAGPIPQASAGEILEVI